MERNLMNDLFSFPFFIESPSFRNLLNNVDKSVFTSQHLKKSFKYPFDVYFKYTDEAKQIVKQIVIEMAIAGFTKENVHVSYNNKTLTVSLDTVKEDVEANCVYRTKGISKKSDSISWEIVDDNIRVDKMKCSLKDGILSLSIPCEEAADSKVFDID